MKKKKTKKDIKEEECDKESEGKPSFLSTDFLPFCALSFFVFFPKLLYIVTVIHN